MASTSVETVTNLSDLKLRCNPHAKSSLKHILTEYGLKVERRRPKAQRKVHSATHFYPEEKKEEKLTLREERNLQVLKDMDILKKHYYDQYMGLLHERIRQQEAKIKERELRQQKRSQTAAAPRPRKKTEKHVLIDDKEYLMKVPKSQAYEFIREEARLSRSGQLKTVSDLEQFWMHTLVKSTMRRFKLTDISQLGQLSPLDDGPGRLADITEDDEDYKMAAKNVNKPWQQARGGKKTSQKALQRKATKDYDEKLFPKVEMPKLHCFDMDIGPAEEDPAETMKDQERSARDKERWVFRKRLQKMYQLAMTNTAAAKRIIANHDEEDVEIMMDSSDVKELIDLDHFISKKDHIRYSSQSSALVPCRNTSPDGRGRSAADSGQETRSLRSGERAPSGSERESPESRSIVSRETDSKRSSASRRSRRSEDSSGIASNSPSVPLSMGDVLPEARIMEAKCLSTLWTNYTKAGTS